jgi:transketolase
MGIDHFGASAPFADIYKGLGLTVDKLVEAARGLVAR